MKSPFILSMLLCLPFAAFADSGNNAAYSFSNDNGFRDEDNKNWDSDLIGNLAEAISNLKTEDKQDVLTLHLGSLKGDESDRLAYRWAILESAREKIKVFQAAFETKSDESFEKLERNDQLNAKHIIDKLQESGDTDLELDEELSPKLEAWLVLQGKIAATKSSVELIDDIESELKTLDKKQKEQADKIALLLKDYPVTTLLLTGSIFSLPEKYQEKLHTFLENGSNKKDIRDIFEDD